MTVRNYGLPPEEFAVLDLSEYWTEYMHYLYLPVVMRGSAGLRMPPNLGFLNAMVRLICGAEEIDLSSPHMYVYVTARRGFAHPGNALNRPGWHADGFGSDDVNYIWSDRYPTRYAVGEFEDISTDHIKSAEQFEEQIKLEERMARHQRDIAKIEVYSGEPNVVYRLTPGVIHATAEIPPPGGDRSFWKVSISPNKYNLLGNSHNHMFDYNWKMWPRSIVRNDPIHGGGDSGPQEA